MVKASMDMRMKAVLLYKEGIKQAKEICSIHGISERTLRRWKSAYERGGPEGLHPKKTGPKKAKHAIHDPLRQRIIVLKQKYPSWGARRIKHQFDLPCHWKTVHNVIKKNGLLIRIKPKPQPCKRFQRRHVDSMWQGDTFQFRIKGVGKVYLTGFTDDCSRYRVASKAYLHKSRKEAIAALRWAFKKGRKPKQMYLDNAKQFIAKDFKDEAAKYHIKLIYGRPYHPRGRGKIESYHRVLYRELISQTEFTSLPHFRKELRKFDQKYNNWRKQEVHGWRTPASIYNDEKHFSKAYKEKEKKRT
jgi:transposase InsO family protein